MSDRRPAKQATPIQRESSWLLAPWWCGLALVFGAPVTGLFLISFTNWDGLDISRVNWVGAANWERMQQDFMLHRALRSSLAFSLLNVPVQLVVGLTLSMLVHNAKRRGFWATAFYSPHALSGVATILAWWWLLNPQVGPINRGIEGAIDVLDALLAAVGQPATGWQAPLWLFSPQWSRPALVLMNAWHAGGVMLIFLAGLGLSQRLLHEAAALDGAGPIRRFRYITLPQLAPFVVLNAVTGVVFSMLAFNQPFLLSNFQQQDSLLFVMYYVYQVGFEQNQIGYAAALSLAMTGLLLALTGAAVWGTRRWVSLGQEAEPA